MNDSPFSPEHARNNRIFKTGYFISLYGVALILLWLGIFKFTPTEAQAIKPSLEHQPFMSWLYKIFSLQMVSNIIGIVEIFTGIAIVLACYSRFFRIAASVGIFLTFLTTLSFLLTSSNVWKIVDGVPVTNFFILKDLVCIGFGLMVLQFTKNQTHT